MKFDVSQSAILGTFQRDKIKNPEAMTCDGCGKTVYVSRGMLPEAIAQAKARKHKLYKVCRKCAEPFLDEVAAGGELAAPSEGAMNLDGVLDHVVEKRRQQRRRFFESN
jgi:hypothetical protein